MTRPGLTLGAVSVEIAGRAIVDRVDAHCAAGTVVGVCGPNGAGKTTLVRAVAGLVAHRGDVLVDGARPAREAVGYLPQTAPTSTGLSVVEVVLLGRVARLDWRVRDDDVDAARAAMARVGVGDLAPRRFATLSGGQRQLVLLAQRLVSTPRLLLLDEPTSALDLRRQLIALDVVRRYAREHAAVVVAVLHDLSLAARFADELMLMTDGRVVAFGAPAAVLTAERIAAVYGVSVEMLTARDGNLHACVLGTA
ncbi:ABC transporter ATP-binding protein [Oharaeibacter diazotrophicus]|uniref:Iron complex transport system ATP-binding protein n=3 Tax=Oharaeibacter diazotrophicus TaxID=1920512 RepID=A0A4R6RGI1_9HYPH|nr:ABC transporter ATP-binding protein [Oharaeibacter diazotrophicus]TDP85453.1 iron complex transport system ATP-binding protein [Oharaeibacter diazotrophicus]BBE74423.1 iron(3+)-hydroxamate import ATP-binding protein FhuC [Pleomorphomonas sp. SM30]GLS75881.1 ABC transporter ATP-binding protein [Oharaeibacter diazotrophicus]